MHRAAFAFVALLTLAGPARAGETITGKVVAVKDGDSITVLTPEKRALAVRLAEIDAPEKNQPFGAKSKQILSAMIFGKEVSVAVVGQDRNGRTIGRVHQDTIDVNLEMVKAGAAWAFTKYVKDLQIPAAQSAAMTVGAGLWALPAEQRRPPWEWRKQRRSAPKK